MSSLRLGDDNHDCYCHFVLSRVDGRTSEQATLAAILNEPDWVFMAGQPGSGKSTLARWLQEQAVALGVRVLTLRPVQLEQSIAFSALGEFVSRLAPEFTDDTAFDQTTRAVLTAAASGASISDAVLLRSAFTSLLQTLTAQGPVVLIIDDAQWIDQQSTEVLSFSVRRALNQQPMLVTYRDDAFPLLVETLKSGRPSPTLTLGPLSNAELALVIAREATVHPTLLSTLAQWSQGSPLRAREIGRAAARGAESVFRVNDLDVPGNPFAPAAAALNADHAKILFVAGQLREPLISTLNQIFDAALITATIEAGLDRGHIQLRNGRIVFDHPLFSDAVTATLSQPDRRALHEAMRGAVIDPIEKARHLSLSTQTLSDDERIEILLASKTAADHGSLSLALQLAYRAMDAAPVPTTLDEQFPSTVFFEATRWIANLEFMTDQGEKAAERLEELTKRLPDGDRLVRIRVDLAGLHSWIRSFPTGIDLFTEILTNISGDSPYLGEVARQLAVLEMVAGSLPNAVAAAERSVLCAADVTSPEGSQALAIRATARVLSGRGADFRELEEAVAAEDVTAPIAVRSGPHHWAAFLYGWLAEPQAPAAFQRHRRIARERGNTTSEAMVAAVEVGCLCERGDIAEAANVVSVCEDLAAFSNEQVVASAHLAAARLLVHREVKERGDSPSAEVLRLLGIGEATFRKFGVRPGLLETADIRIAAWSIVAEYRPLIDLTMVWLGQLQRSGLYEPMLVPGLLNAIEATAVVGDERSFQKLRSHVAGVADSNRSNITAALDWAEASWLAASGADAQEAANLYARAAKVWAAGGRRFWEARVELALGKLSGRAASKRAGAVHFESAAQKFRALEAHGWADVALRELERSSAARSGPLSPTELSVAQAAAAGLSNHEIAEKFFISHRTVESHLSNAYSKLRIARRSQLGLALASTYSSAPVDDT